MFDVFCACAYKQNTQNFTRSCTYVHTLVHITYCTYIEGITYTHRIPYTDRYSEHTPHRGGDVYVCTPHTEDTHTLHRDTHTPHRDTHTLHRDTHTLHRDTHHTHTHTTQRHAHTHTRTHIHTHGDTHTHTHTLNKYTVCIYCMRACISSKSKRMYVQYYTQCCTRCIKVTHTSLNSTLTCFDVTAGGIGRA